MGWKKDVSKARVKRIAESVGTVEISDLRKEMKLSNVALRKPKRIEGVHLYIGPRNEKELVDELLSAEERAAARTILRRVHLYQREVGRIIGDFDAAQVHFQGTRLHALVYRPVGDQEEVVARAVSMALAIELGIRRALAEALPDDPCFSLRAGASHGKTLATMSGERGDSELLFIGNAANQGAKVLSDRRLRVTSELRELLNEDYYGISVEPLGDGTYSLAMERSAIEEAASRFAGGWTLERSIKRVAEDAQKLPVEAFSVKKATSEIDKDSLGRSNSKLNDALSVFGDLDGFTAVVEAARSDRERAALVRAFHIIRYELNYVRKDDYSGSLRVQYQGDRIQVLRHLPHAEPGDRALDALRIAAGWQSSIRETLPEVVDRDDLRLATGIAAGPTIVSKLGTTGNRDVLALGPDVRRAERIQRNIDGDEVGVAGPVHELLPEDVAALFGWRAGAQGYVAEDLRINQLELALQAESLAAGESQRVARRNGAYLVGALAGTALGAAATARTKHPQAQEAHARPRRRWSR